MKTSRDKLNSLEVELIGNRITTLGVTLATGSIIAIPLVTVGTVGQDIMQAAVYFGTLATGLFLLGITKGGNTTYKIYQRTAKHIKEHGKLDPRFLRKIVRNEENNMYPNKTHCHGYCEEQGVYLAARDYGQLDVFREEKERYSDVVIPNFKN